MGSDQSPHPHPLDADPLDADPSRGRPHSHVTCDACWEANTSPLVNRMTDRCKNITLPQTLFAGSNKKAFQWDAYHPLLWFRGLGGYTLPLQISYPSSGCPTPMRNMGREIPYPPEMAWDQERTEPPLLRQTPSRQTPPAGCRPLPPVDKHL